jgi:capsular polysaccharide biosynthesis protein
LSVDPRAAVRLMVVAVVLVAMAVTSASLLQPPTYEAEALVLVGERSPAQGTENVTQTMVHAIESRPVVEEVIRRWELEMTPDELLDRLTVQQVEGTQFVRLTYEDTDPERARLIANTVGKETPEFSPERSSTFGAAVWEKADLPTTPVSPHPLRNGLLTLVTGLVFCAGTLVALPGIGARVAGTLDERPSRQGIGQAGVLSRRHSDYSIVERVKEKKLLRAIGRRGKLTAVQAALDTSLSVEESRRILEELAFAGHLEITFEDGKLLYSFWGHGAP